MKRGVVYQKIFDGDWLRSLFRLLNASSLNETLLRQKRVLIKPNIVEALEPPITTPVGLVASIVDYVKSAVPDAEVIVGDGTGSLEYDTYNAFDRLGYTAMAEEKGITLTDLNDEPLIELKRPELKRWPEMHLPEIVMESYLISVPVLKAHSLAGVTLTMKNMMGACPPSHYCKGGHWKKSSFHERIHEAIADLNRYRTPDFTVLDATVGMSEAHLWGAECDPRPNLILASFDPVAIDACGCGILNRGPVNIGHITMVDGELGCMEGYEVVEV